MKRWFLLPLFALACSAVHADLYRWVDADGKVHYSDQPPAADIKQVEKKKESATGARPSSSKPASGPTADALQQAVKNFPLTLYNSECGDLCKAARDLLVKRGVPFTEKDATDSAVQAELKKVTGGALEVPVLTIGTNVVRGFENVKWGNALDGAGYPQAAPIAPKSAAKPQ